MQIPEINSIFHIDGVNWIVKGIGEIYFEYESNKGIFAFINLDEMDCLAILIERKRVKIIVDPSIPSIIANNQELINEYGPIGTYALLEYDRDKN